MIGVDRVQLRELLEQVLPQQRWFGAKDRKIASLELNRLDVLTANWPMLLHGIADVTLDDGRQDCYQLLLGVRPAGMPMDFLHGSEHAVVGAVETDAGPGIAYDATLDHDLGHVLLEVVAPGESAKVVRVIAAEQSNTSLVYDDRLILKFFRRLPDGPNRDVEVTEALARAGFHSVAEPVAAWTETVDGTVRHLAFLQRFLAGSSEGWALALTSLRDVYVDRIDPAEAGGDFAGEASRLGQVTAEMHIALADAFERQPGDAGAWADQMAQLYDRVRHPALDRSRLGAMADRLRAVDDVGLAIQVHGDLHLGQVMRTDEGWYILDFEGEPARPLAERQMRTSPLKDVAGMVRSFHYAARVALLERDEAEREAGLDKLALEWETRNRTAFLGGYLARADDSGLLPAEPDDWAVVMAAFELEKAVYELAYEQAHRPDWVEIPLAAIRRILEDAT
jgi:maltokinase